MFLLPSINSKNIFEDGSFINALSFCKNNFCTDRRCIEHYKKLVENNTSCFKACPYGLVSYLLIQDENKKIIFTSLREKSRYKPKNKKFQNDFVFNLVLPEDKILQLLNSSEKDFNDRLQLMEKMNTFDAMEHEVKKLNSSIKDNCDSFINLFKENKDDLYSLTEDEYKMLFKKIKTLYVTSNLINLRYSIYDYEKDPNSLISDSFYNINIHGKFVKCSKILENYKESNAHISFYGETHKHMKAYPSFDLIPFLILENALKYTLDDNEINVDFEEKDNTLNVSISSISLYCSQDDIPHIFEKGYRGKNASRNKKSNGTGTGLYFTKVLCDLHDITINANSDTNIIAKDGVNYSLFSISLTFNSVFD